jgi:glycosyltransferase involved in cell wall biosynthesis
MKILVLNYEFPPVGGGGGRASADLAKSLAGRGHDLRVITSHKLGLERELETDGYQVHRVFTGRRSSYRASFASMLAYVVGAFFPTLIACWSWKPAVMHVHFAVPTGALAYAVSKLTGIPYLLTVHLGDVPGGVPEKTQRWFQLIYPFTHRIWRSAAKVVAVSEFTRQLALEHYDVPITVIPNAVELSRIGSSPKAPNEIPKLIFAGRFQPQKNLLFLIDALSHVEDLLWECTLVGDGPMRRSIEDKIDGLGLGDRIEVTGWVTSEEVWDRLSDSDILVMPSLSEGLPVVGVQALAQGLAIVANRAGGLIDLVQEGVNGRLCPVGDERCFLDSLRECLSNRDMLARMKGASRRLAERFEMRTVAKRYERLLERIVE